jgi:hypothetical protein
VARASSSRESNRASIARSRRTGAFTTGVIVGHRLVVDLCSGRGISSGLTQATYTLALVTTQRFPQAYFMGMRSVGDIRCGLDHLDSGDLIRGRGAAMTARRKGGQ